MFHLRKSTIWRRQQQRLFLDASSSSSSSSSSSPFWLSRHHNAVMQQSRQFSIQTPPPPDETPVADPVANKIARAVYRHLLRWCQSTPDKLPLSSVLPPVTLEPPADVNAYRLEVLAAGADDMGDVAIQKARQYMPAHMQLQSNQLTCLLSSTTDLANLIRVLFRLNSGNDVQDREHLKERQGSAFTALKSLNELRSRLDSIQEERNRHLDRTDIKFCIGQVVQHKDERWRGVISDWSRSSGSPQEEDTASKKRRTSLTTKDYSTDEFSSNENEGGDISYNIILDAGDAHAMGSPSGWIRTSETDLEAVTDPHLIRIRSNHLLEKFVRFDSDSKLFVPSELQAYHYPIDQPNFKLLADLDPQTLQLCQDITEGAQALASSLQRCILDETSCAKERRLELLSNVQERLEAIANGDVQSKYELLNDNTSPVTLACHHLRDLLGIQLELSEVNAKRNITKESADKIAFKVGDVVNHSFFGFRGVIIGWDPKPVYDVRKWDGLQHVDNPMDLPFYHVAPDQSDCIKSFGGPRGIRYVCQANLELCSAEDKQSLAVDLDPEWKRNEETYSYIPPPSLAYQYGVEGDEAATTERCLQRLQNDLNTWYLQARSKYDVDDEMFKKISLANIHVLLKNVDNQLDAYPIQETIKEIRKAHPNMELKNKLDAAIASLVNGQGEKAKRAYKELVQTDSSYAEAWNRLATCQFMFGKYDESLESTKKVLELDPVHFQALNGLGLIHFEKGNYQEAAEAFRMSTTLDPWSPVSSKLSLTLDLFNRLIYREEIP